MLDKSNLGNRFSCFECGTKFYDLNRPAALCPECDADQANAPIRDIKSILAGGRNRAMPTPKETAVPEETAAVEDGEGEEDALDLGLGNDEDEEIELEDEDEVPLIEGMPDPQDSSS